MSSKTDIRKKSGGISGNGKLLSDVDTISKAYYMDRTRPSLTSSTVSSRSKSIDRSQLPEPKMKPEDVKNKTKDPFEKDKKSSIWSWKGLKAFANARPHRFNCCFSLLVHNIEGLPAIFENVCLVVHWKRRDGEQMTHSTRVHQGVAEFEEQLTHSCFVQGTRNGLHHSAKYDSKHFLLYVSVAGAPEHDLGRHRVDLTRLLPLTLEELEEEKCSGKWMTSFRLSGKARGATINVSFGYMVLENGNTDPSRNKNVPETLSSKRNSIGTSKVVGSSDQRNGVGVHRAGSLPASSAALNSPEDIKDLHEILPTSRSDLCDSVNTLYQKFDEDMSKTAVVDKLENNTLPSHMDPLKKDIFAPPDAGDKICRTKCEVPEFSVIEKGAEELAGEQIKLKDDFSLNVTQNPGVEAEGDSLCVAQSSVAEMEDESLNVAQNSVVETEAYALNAGQNSLVETENGSFNVAQNSLLETEDDSLSADQNSGVKSENDLVSDVAIELENAPVHLDVETVPQNDEDFNYEDKENDLYSTESVMKDLEAALNSASDLVDEGVDSGEPDADALLLENYLEIGSEYGDEIKGKSICLDDVTDTVASDFLEMLGIEHSPFGLSSESEPESPRERLLREFEKESLANGGLLNFDFGIDLDESFNPMGSEESNYVSTYESFKDMSEEEADAFRARMGGLAMEDLETEDLMREWGINEKAFQQSPRSHPSGFDNSINIPPEDPQQLPPLAKGLGSFMETKDGGFIRSMNPAVFRNGKSGGSLIMQVSNPVVVPAEMGSSVMDVLQGLASVGIEKLSMQASKLMPLEDITEKTIQQMVWESAPCLEGSERSDILQPESATMKGVSSKQKSVNKVPPHPSSSKLNSSLHSSDTEYVSLEDLAPLAMDKIEALSIEGLRIQSGMSDEEAPSNISSQSIGEFSALRGKTVDTGGSIGLDGTCGLQLLDIKDNGEDVDGLMSLSLTLDEWMKLDSGEIDDDDLMNERTSKILAAHHATSLDQFRGRSRGEKRRSKSRKYGLLGNNFTVALMVQLRDPLRNYEPVGTPMLSLIQVERVFIPPKPKLYSTVSLVRKSNEDDAGQSTNKNSNKVERPNEKAKDEEPIPQYKIAEVHVAGLKVEQQQQQQGKKKLWGSTNQQQSGSRWLLANGMGKKNKNPIMKSKTVGKSGGVPMTTTVQVQPGDTLWSISSRVLGTGAKWKELAKLNPHIRNPNVVLPAQSSIRLG